MKRNRVPTIPELPVEAAPPYQKYASASSNERGKALSESLFPTNCKYCRTAIEGNQAIYMYRDFCAYCSVECRQIQMEIDEKIEGEERRQKLAKAKAKSSK